MAWRVGITEVKDEFTRLHGAGSRFSPGEVGWMTSARPGSVRRASAGAGRAFVESKRTTLPHRKNIRTCKSSPYYNRNALVKNISFYLNYNYAGKR